MRGVVAARVRCRRAFTLIEMLVSLAVLAVALSVVGVVFTITTKTISQAAAVSEVQAIVRQFMIQLEQDLNGIESSRSVLVISGRTQRAALNADDLAARASWRVLVGNPNDRDLENYDPRLDPGLDPNKQYSNPRTDILSFFTSRPMVSKAPATNIANDPFLLGAKGSPVHVTYGFAALADAAGDNERGWRFDENSIRHIYTGGAGNGNISPIPITQWHLARRAIIINNISTSSQRTGWTIGDSDFTALRRSYSDNPSQAGDVAPLDFELNLAFLSLPAIVRDTPYTIRGATQNWANDMLYGRTSGSEVTNRHIATVIPQPPAALRSNLGVHMLPACAWFQVEFLMPEDPRNSIDYFDPRITFDRNFRDDMPQWVEVEEGQTYVFVPDSAANRSLIANESGGATPRLPFFASMDITDPDNIRKKRIRTWPYAIRITIRVFDPLGRLDEPMERSLIHRFE